MKTSDVDMLALESAIIDCEGHVLLLDLAIEAVFKDLESHREGHALVFRLTDDQVRAISHASCLIWSSVQDAGKVFYGKRQIGARE